MARYDFEPDTSFSRAEMVERPDGEYIRYDEILRDPSVVLLGVPLSVLHRFIGELQMNTGKDVEAWFKDQDKRIEQTIKAMIRYIPGVERIGSPYAIGATLVRFVTEDGSMPPPPSPAYAVAKDGRTLYTLTTDQLDELLFRAR